MQKNTTRRAVIGALASLPAVAVAAPAVSRPVGTRGDWDRLRAAYEAAKAVEDEYERTVWTPAYEADRAEEAARGNPWPGVETNDREAISRYYARKRQPDWQEPGNLTPEIEAEMERLSDLRDGPETELMNYPAPDAEALSLKLKIAFGDDRDANGYLDVILADADRFLARGRS